MRKRGHAHGDVGPADARVEAAPGFEAPPVFLGSDLSVDSQLEFLGLIVELRAVMNMNMKMKMEPEWGNLE